MSRRTNLLHKIIDRSRPVILIVSHRTAYRKTHSIAHRRRQSLLHRVTLHLSGNDRHPANKHIVKHRTKSIDIGLRRKRLQTAVLLHRSKTIAAALHTDSRRRFALVVKMLSKTKINQHRHTLTSMIVHTEHNILRLDVEMIDVVRMQKRNRLSHRQLNVERSLLRQRTVGLNQIAQRTPVEILHHIIDRIVRLKHLAHRHHIRILAADLIQPASLRKKIATALLHTRLQRLGIAHTARSVALASILHEMLLYGEICKNRHLVEHHRCRHLICYSKTALTKHCLNPIIKLRTFQNSADRQRALKFVLFHIPIKLSVLKYFF